MPLRVYLFVRPLLPRLIALLCGGASLTWAADPKALAWDAPGTVLEGDTLRVTIRSGVRPGMTVEFMHRALPFFPAPAGTGLALLPVAVGTTPGSYEITLRDEAGQALAVRPVEVRSAQLPIQNIRVGRATKALEPLPGEMEAIGALQRTLTPERHWQEPFRSPTPQCMNSRFGVLRYHNGKPSGRYHKGLDLRSPAGEPVRATTGGRVQIARMFRLHGGTIGLDHGQGVTSVYLHLSRLAATEGAVVQPGEVIGYVGSTGFATGPHLHWGLYVHGTPVTPQPWTGAVPPCGGN